jgi:MiaB/RimO family radical SAM methylthiotransferase
MTIYEVFISNEVGCESTEAEGNRVINYLKLNGHHIVNNPQKAEYIILNTCAFLEIHRARIKDKLQSVLKDAPHAKVIIMGCVREIAEDILKPFNIHKCCGHYDLDRLDDIFANIISFNETDKFSFSQAFEKLVIVASRGCTGACTYCSIKKSTGSVHSRAEKEIINDISNAVNHGYNDFFITGDDLGSYGLDLGTDLSSLLTKISQIDLEIRVLLGNINPKWINKYIDDLASFYEKDLAHKWIFFPIQSANNEVIRSMGRSYTIEECIDSIRKLSNIKDMKFYYDVMVGFPTETDSDFSDTLKFLLNYPPSDGMVSTYSPETGTPAYKLKPLPKEVLEERRKRLNAVYRASQYILHKKDPNLLKRFGT